MAAARSRWDGLIEPPHGKGVGAVLALHQAYLATCVLRDMGMWPKKEGF
ncbi:hypothetical protein [Heliomicrobium modesticaldum]|nr:hypothetical protein [Heliomicrobium modesticaldum]